MRGISIGWRKRQQTGDWREASCLKYAEKKRRKLEEIAQDGGRRGVVDWRDELKATGEKMEERAGVWGRRRERGMKSQCVWMRVVKRMGREICRGDKRVKATIDHCQREGWGREEWIWLGKGRAVLKMSWWGITIMVAARGGETAERGDQVTREKWRKAAG